MIAVVLLQELLQRFMYMSGLVWPGLVWSIIGDEAKFVKSFLMNFSGL